MHALTRNDLVSHFPHEAPRIVQSTAIDVMVRESGGLLLEIPTGEGKTALGLSALCALSERGQGPLFYVAPTKVMVEQVAALLGSRAVPIFGRSEYSCLYYDAFGRKVTAEESPCYMLDCPHRVDQKTGETADPAVTPCPYFEAKYKARQKAEQGGIIVTTTAFFLVNRLLVPPWSEMTPALVVLDEVHRIANICRSVFEQTLTDWHLRRSIELLQNIAPQEARKFSRFRKLFMAQARKGKAGTPHLLKEEEIEALIGALETVDASALERAIRDAFRNGRIDPIANERELKTLEQISRGIPRLLRALRYSLPDEEQGRHALNYLVAFYYKKDDLEAGVDTRRSRFYLTIKSYHVVGSIRKAVGPNVLGYSATIGDPMIFGFDSGLSLPFESFPSSFNADNTLIIIPTDTPNLAFHVGGPKYRRHPGGGRQGSFHDRMDRAGRMVASAAARFKTEGSHRSLIVVNSESERRRLFDECIKAGLNPISYEQNGRTAKQAALAFKAGEGDVLIGTAAQYAEGIDLPAGIAPVIFFLRPGFAPPDDPQTQFERRRFPQSHFWALQKWRVMMTALQVRGRNIRSRDDNGVCFFISQQFRDVVYPALPEWLKGRYRREWTMEEAIKGSLELLDKKS